jgi:hypothetical protein
VNAASVKAEKELVELKLDAEKSQLIHRRRFELADALLADAYRFRAMMRDVRRGNSLGNEGETRKATGSESQVVKQTRDRYFVPIERLGKETEFISNFEAKRFTAQAHFGIEIVRAFDLFIESVNLVLNSSSILIETADHPNKDQNTIYTLREDIWEGFASARGRRDEVGDKIQEGIALFERFCRPALEWRGAS